MEDRVHQLLSSRLENIFSLFGQIPDVLESVWISVAQGAVDEAKRLIEGVQCCSILIPSTTDMPRWRTSTGRVARRCCLKVRSARC